jgi:hypothetical protein
VLNFKTHRRKLGEAGEWPEIVKGKIRLVKMQSCLIRGALAVGVDARMRQKSRSFRFPQTHRLMLKILSVSASCSVHGRASGAKVRRYWQEIVRLGDYSELRPILSVARPDLGPN